MRAVERMAPHPGAERSQIRPAGTREHARVRSEAAPLRGGRRTVLLVEDDPRLRRLVYHMLKRTYRVLEAGDAAAAIAAIEGGGVDLVLLDLHLPPRGESPAEGLRVVDWIAKTMDRVPVVVMSGDQDRSLPESLRRGGVKEFLPKPLDVGRLLEVVGDTLGGTGETRS